MRRTSFEHFMAVGNRERRRVNYFFDEALYSQLNPDIEQGVIAGDWHSGIEHFVAQGQMEERRFSLLFDEAFYLRTNPWLLKHRNLCSAFSEEWGRYLRQTDLHSSYTVRVIRAASHLLFGFP